MPSELAIHPLGSKLASASVPLRLRLDTGLPDKAALQVTARLQRPSAGANSTSTVIGEAAGHSNQGQAIIAIDAGPLAPGDYTVELTVTAPGLDARATVTFHRLATPLQPPFPFGVYAVPFPADPDARRDMLRQVKEAGINLICNHMDSPQPLSDVWDDAARLGLAFMPSTNLHLAASEMPQGAGDRLHAGESESDRRPCFGSSWVRQRAADDLEHRLTAFAAHPGFSGRVYYGDDLFMRYRCDAGRVEMTCRCDACREDFRGRTGMEIPGADADAPAPRECRGVVPPDEPHLMWMRHRCAHTFGGFVAALDQRRAEVAPDVSMGLCHGFPFAPFTHARAGIYGPLTQRTSVVSSYAYPYLRSPRADLIGHFELARMGNRDKDVWMLGAINSNWTNYPTWQVFQNYWNMLAAGYRLIAFFGWHDFESGRQLGYDQQVEECRRALGVVGAHKDWLLPLAAHWRPAPAPQAVLYSFTTECFDLTPENRGHLHLERVLDFHRQALRTRTPLEITCEEEVLDGWIDRYRTVCLRDVRALRRDVVDALAAWARRGGRVLIENDILWDYDENHLRVEVPGAIQAAPETMLALLRDALPTTEATPAVADSPHVTIRHLHAGQIEHLVLVNNFADQYWGFRFHYWDQRVPRNYEDMKRVRDEAVTTTLRAHRPGCHLADAETGEVLGPADEPLRLHLSPSWGRVLAVIPCPEVALEVEAAATVRADEEWAITLRAVRSDGADRRPLAAALAARVTLLTPSGQASPVGGMVGLDDGVARLRFRPGLTADLGQWRLRVEGGYPRRVIERGFQVEAPRGQRVPLRLQCHPDGRP